MCIFYQMILNGKDFEFGEGIRHFTTILVRKEKKCWG